MNTSSTISARSSFTRHLWLAAPRGGAARCPSAPEGVPWCGAGALVPSAGKASLLHTQRSPPLTELPCNTVSVLHQPQLVRRFCRGRLTGAVSATRYHAETGMPFISYLHVTGFTFRQHRSHELQGWVKSVPLCTGHDICKPCGFRHSICTAHGRDKRRCVRHT